METKNEFQELLDKLLKEQEEKLAKQHEKEKQALVSQFEQREQEWSSLFEAQTQAVAKGVADHIGKEVVESYTAKFGAEAEATQHAKGFPFQEQGQVALQLMREDGKVMTADEFIAKHTTTWDEFNFMGGLSNQVEQAQTFDPFKEQPAGPMVNLDADTKDVMAAIDYQVQNYSTEDNFPIEGEPAIATATPFSKARAQAAIQSLRAGSTEDSSPTAAQAPVEAPKVQEPAISMTKQDTEVMPSVTPEMEAAAMESASFMSDAEFIRKTTQAPFPEIENYRTISPSDPKLSLNTLFDEMSTEKFKVSGNSKELVNYFDKTRHFDFKGKTAEEHRANAIEKHDLKEWLNTFQPGLKTMKDAHESELRLMPFDATDRDLEEMKLKHKVEQKFFELSEKTELSQAAKLFKNELPENLPAVAAPTQRELDELRDTFRDYAAHRMGKTWKHTYKNADQDPHAPKRIDKELLVRAMQRNQEMKNIARGREQAYQIERPSQTQVKRQIKAIRQVMR